MKFIPLHINTVYSYLNSALPIDKLIERAKKWNIDYLAISDINSLTASINFFRSAKEANIKPIIGLDLQIEDNLFTFIVKSEEGYKNLLTISKLFNENKLTKIDIKKHNNGLAIVISSVQSKLINKYQELGDIKFAYYLKDIQDLASDFYIGLEIYDENDKANIKKLRDFLLKRDYKLLAFPLVRYLDKEDELTYRIVRAIKEDKKLDENEKTIIGKHYLCSDEEISKLYEEDEINNNRILASSVNFELIKKRGKIIEFSKTADEDLHKLAYEGITKKIINITDEYKERLEYELNVIKRMGYSNYFLIVNDYVNFAKKSGIYVGPGRGSAGGSLVAYALDIITFDPIKNDLIFERFLNEGRKSMPDIDADFEDVRRDEVVSYIRKRYGTNRVGNILTTQTIKAKQAIRDIGRVYNVSDSYINMLSKAIGDSEDLRSAYKESTVFKKLVDSDPYYLFIVKAAKRIEGFPRQTSIHAAGVIINDEPLDSSLPVYVDSFNNYTSELEKDDLEALGFLKMDVLGLKNITIVKEVLNAINKKETILKYEDIPYQDEEGLKLISAGETLGLFQLESKGMIRTCKEFKPATFDDVVCLIALFRPGPMKFIPQYIARKEGKEKIVYPSDKIKDILEPTYGIIVYQEQIMQIVRRMANYSYSEADMFRRAISKKDASLFVEEKKTFIDAAVKNNCSREESEKVFELIKRFANYGFNKSHAFAYAKLAGQMAYLKAHYTPIFYAAVLDSDDKFNEVVSEIRNHNIKLSLPDINKAEQKYRPLDNEIIMPFSKIKGILNQSVSSLIKERENNGPYKNFIDFVVRNIKYKISKTVIIKLIDAGSFDSFNNNRSSLRNAVDDVINYALLTVKDNEQIKFDETLLPPPHIEVIKDDEMYNADKEYETLGTNISKSPLDFYKNIIKEKGLINVSEIDKKNKYISTIGLIKSIRRIKTKNNKRMCFITISDNIDEINVTVFNELYQKHEEGLFNAKILIVKGRYDVARDELIAEELEIL